jgi:hypothetical protein
VISGDVTAPIDADQVASAVVVLVVFIAALIKAWKHPHD